MYKDGFAKFFVIFVKNIFYPGLFKKITKNTL